MKIDVVQTISEGSNQFEVLYNDQLKYRAILPFVTINEPLNLEKIRSMKVNNLEGNTVYQTNYDYIENLKEEIIPLKYLVTKNQKFNQIVFHSEEKDIKIYYEENEIWFNRYIIEQEGKRYFVYSIMDGIIRHFPIYDGETQIGEALKSNVKIDGKDEYRIYLKDNSSTLADAVSCLMLFLDRSEYSSSYIVNKSKTVSYSYSYNKTNKYYNKNWVATNFDNSYMEKVQQQANVVKQDVKKQFSITMIAIGIGLAVVFVGFIIVVLAMLLF